MAVEKRVVRNRMLARRTHMAEEECCAKSKIICGKLLAGSWYAEATVILVYSAIRNEVNLSAMIEQAWKDGKELFFPKVEGENLRFYRVESWEQLKEGSFHVLEPEGKELSAFDLRSDKTPAAVLVPGVAFSEEGHRIGYGKGYYDRFLAANRECFPIGIAYELQMCSFAAESNDRQMKAIVTENREVVLNDGFGRIM